MHYRRWVVRRLWLGILVIWGAATTSFVALQLLPGNPALVIAGGGNNYPSEATLRAVERTYGFDKSIVTQYLTFLGRLLRGDFGDSYQLHQPVGSILSSQAAASAELAAGGAIIGALVGVAVALATAGRPRAAGAARCLELLAVSTPGFWIGLVLLSLFSFDLHLFPVIGNDGVSSLVLPWITLALPVAGSTSLVMREEMEQALVQPFALTVRARGVSESRLRSRHLLKHTAPPVLTLSSWIVGQLFGGVVVIEQVFARDGLGQTLVAAVEGRDLPVVTGVVVFVAVVFVLVNFVVDGLYLAVDPRLRRQPA
ncbi:ABC transporter permease [Patulibacter sp. NPDC049589]|uniref:ABC transporter permease n=1 Tax=Patulibacter sp. NPDC049589 TaxID=3154731 RepID=UPI0034230D2E